MKRFISIVVAVAVCLIIGFLSHLLQVDALISWYPKLSKSLLTPPDAVFSIVWFVIYLSMGFSIGILYSAHSVSKKPVLWLYGIQLLLNVCWSFFFFYMHVMLAGFVILLILDILAIISFVALLWLKRISAFLFTPYMLWILFATYLNMYMVIYN